MTAATARFQAAAADIAGGAGDLEHAVMELMISKISFQAGARVAEVAAQMSDRLLDITV